MSKLKYGLKILRREGIISFSRKTLYFTIGQLMGIIAYPLCRLGNIKFIPVHTSALGHLSAELDCYIKEEILGLRPKFRGILLAPLKQVANPHLLNYWKKYILIINNPIFSFLLRPLCNSFLIRYDVEKYFCGDYRGTQYPNIQKQYHGRHPVLSLTDFDFQRGKIELRKLGVPENAWFVCVHCREGGQLGLQQGQTHRDVEVSNYYLAIEEITKRGGWIFRMGDATMKPIPAMKNVIDYAHLSIKSDWMDVFLSASCKFLLGSNSGFYNLASVFGVSSVIANIAGPFSAPMPYGSQDIGIPKLIYSLKEKRYLSFTEILSSPIGNYREDYLFTDAGLRVIENPPEDIKEATIEMLDRLEGKCIYSEEDEILQARFRSLMNPTHFSYGAASRVGRAFLKKYEYLLKHHDNLLQAHE